MLEIFDDIVETLDRIGQAVIYPLIKLFFIIIFPVWIIPYLIIKAIKEKEDTE